MECAAGGGCGVRDSSLRAGCAQHAASRGRHAALRPRDLRLDQRLRGRPRSLAQARQRRVHWPRCSAGCAGRGRAEAQVLALEMVERGIARDGYPVLDLDGNEIGVVTSGSPAPFLKTNIAFALVPAAVAASGDRSAGAVSAPIACVRSRCRRHSISVLRNS